MLFVAGGCVCADDVAGVFAFGAGLVFVARWVRRLVFPALGDGFEAGGAVSTGFSAGVVALPPVVVGDSEDVDGGVSAGSCAGGFSAGVVVGAWAWGGGSCGSFFLHPPVIARATAKKISRT